MSLWYWPYASAVRIEQILFTQGFGTRRECAALCRHERVRVDGRIIEDPDQEFATEALSFQVDSATWPYRPIALLMLHKPAGYECSRQPHHHPSVLSLLPAPLRRRGVQPVGRLDVDSTGLLLLTDDGALVHELTSPRKEFAKVYEVTTKHAVDADLVQRLRDGVQLRDDPAPVRAAQAEAVDDHHLRLTLTQGKYHQVKRMVAAAGNRVAGLHRSAVGALRLPSSLAEGQWAWLDRAALG